MLTVFKQQQQQKHHRLFYLWLLIFIYIIISLIISFPIQALLLTSDEPRLVAIGDMHGDIVSCRRILQAANIINKEDKWIAGKSTVIQLGDIADRGTHYHEIYDLFASLEKQANLAGGEFTFLIGNHELFNLIGDFRYVPPEVVKIFGGPAKYAEAFHPRGVYGKYILQHSVIIAREGVVFVHAGVMPEYARRGVDGINEDFIRGFNNNINNNSNEHKNNNNENNNNNNNNEQNNNNEHNNNNNEQNNNNKTKLSHSSSPHPFSTLESPVWSRTLLREARRGNCSLVKESLKLLSQLELAAGRPEVRIMIGGHTIQIGGEISLECDGALIAADVGISTFLPLNGGYSGYVEFVRREESNINIINNNNNNNNNNNIVRIPVPRYPFGKGRRNNNAAAQRVPVRPPQRLLNQVLEDVKGQENNNNNNNNNNFVIQKNGGASFGMRGNTDMDHVEMSLSSLEYFMIFFMIIVIVSIFILRLWKPFTMSHRVYSKRT